MDMNEHSRVRVRVRVRVLVLVLVIARVRIRIMRYHINRLIRAPPANMHTYNLIFATEMGESIVFHIV